MFLGDTNIWLEVLLERRKAEEVREFLQQTDSTLLCMTDFSLYSIGIFLLRSKKYDVFLRFIADSLDRVGVQIVRLGTADLENIVQVSRRFGLDFDDAYQYVAAEKHNLTIVSFDSDFDRTERGRKTPAEVVRSEEA